MSNRGVPLDHFSPEAVRKVKYHIAYYLSTHRLSEDEKAFVCPIDDVINPKNI